MLTAFVGVTTPGPIRQPTAICAPNATQSPSLTAEGIGCNVRVAVLGTWKERLSMPNLTLPSLLALFVVLALLALWQVRNMDDDDED
jgi:hypothetical protein